MSKDENKLRSHATLIWSTRAVAVATSVSVPPGELQVTVTVFTVSLHRVIGENVCDVEAPGASGTVKNELMSPPKSGSFTLSPVITTSGSVFLIVTR